QILNEVLNPIHSSGVAALLLGLLDTAQVEPRAAARLCLRHPLRNVFFGFSFEVLAQLIIQFLVRLRPAKQRPQPQGNREQPMLRSHSPALLHSYLRATMGSTRIARRAGKYPATSATADSTPTATAIVYVSCAAMPNNKLCNKRTEPSATPTPIATPTTRISSTSRNTSLKLDPGCATSAIRTPNSVCRCVTR